jgi:hypothetical protein
MLVDLCERNGLIFTNTCIDSILGKKHLYTGLFRPGGFKEVEAPRFQDNWHMIVVRLSALFIGQIYLRKCSWFSVLLEAESA